MKMRADVDAARDAAPVTHRRLAGAQSEGGFTMVEVLVASVLASVVAGGTMMAFITAARISHEQSSPSIAEAGGYAQETVERFRNRVAASQAQDPAFGDNWLTTTAGAGWTNDPLPPPASGGTESILGMGTGAKRCYRLTAADCDGVPGNDCYALEVKVCWKDLTGCPCP